MSSAKCRPSCLGLNVLILYEYSGSSFLSNNDLVLLLSPDDVIQHDGWHISKSPLKTQETQSLQRCQLSTKVWHHEVTVVNSSHSCGRAGSTVETLYSTIYHSKYFIELNFDKSTRYVALWTHKRHPIPRPFGRAMECLLWVLQQKLTVL